MTTRGRKPKWLTIEKFDQFVGNDFYHLKRDVSSNKWLLRVIFAALITAALVDRLV